MKQKNDAANPLGADRNRKKIKNMAHKYTNYFSQSIEIDIISFAIWAILMIIFPLIVLL